jgi:hypothetical protein
MSDPLVGQAHAWLASGTAVVATTLGILGVGAAAGIVPPAHARIWLDRGVLLLAGVAGLAAFVGAILLLVVGPPADWLHLVYAGVALGAAPGARLIAGWRHSPRLGLWLTAGSLVTLGALLRLWMTGA